MQLALAVVRTVLAAHCYWKLAHALPQLAAFVLSLAEEAGGGMVGEGEEHLQGMSSHLLELLGAGMDNQSLGCRGIAG